MSTTEVNPASRREVWLSIALAVARDGLPIPTSVRISDNGAHRPWLYLNFDQHADTEGWARHYGATTRAHDREDLGNRYWTAEADAEGWHLYIEGNEPLPSPTAAHVVEAILTPDSAALPAELVSA